jgi:hypothetical protein
MIVSAGWIPVGGRPRRIRRESEILEIAIGLAADSGDPAPSLIQHTRCTRAQANRVAGGAIVPGEEESYLIAIQGHFTVQRRRPPMPPGFPALVDATDTYSVMTLVVNVATGAPTDSGLSNDYPDLAAVGSVITDHGA